MTWYISLSTLGIYQTHNPMNQALCLPVWKIVADNHTTIEQRRQIQTQISLGITYSGLSQTLSKILTDFCIIEQK